MSFKRKINVVHPRIPLGIKQSPSSSSLFTTSTGIPSLDDILGGGLPLTNVLNVLSPNPHSSFPDLLLKYFIAQGILSSHSIYIIDPSAEDLVAKCMWLPPSAPDKLDQEPDTQRDSSQNIKIAWRYENMKQFETTVPIDIKEEVYCSQLDLTCQIPEDVLSSVRKSGQLRLFSSPRCKDRSIWKWALAELTNILRPSQVSDSSTNPGTPVRICIRNLGSPEWGDYESSDVLRFLLQIRALLRQTTDACALITTTPRLSNDRYEGVGWIQKVASLCDGCISLAAFVGDPTMETTFPNQHGLLHIHSLPTTYTLQPPSDKLSQLRGLLHSQHGGAGENNLAFKCTRRKFLIETFHLDVKGGVNERRMGEQETSSRAESLPDRSSRGESSPKIQLELPMQFNEEQAALYTGSQEPEQRPKNARKAVMFKIDRPDVLDF